jgi:hypothetical protein
MSNSSDVAVKKGARGWVLRYNGAAEEKIEGMNAADGAIAAKPTPRQWILTILGYILPIDKILNSGFYTERRIERIALFCSLDLDFICVDVLAACAAFCVLRLGFSKKREKSYP